MKIVVRGLDDPIELANRQFPEGSPGLALVRSATCGCRTLYMLPVYALVYAGIRACIGISKPGTHVRPASARSQRAAAASQSVYSFREGKMLVDVHER